ncbi:MAG: hypothetical protein NUW37_04815 [Planctomycetes bacterium]|nr:hypothetical protein [Planctomycetota bacterium]
MRNAVTLLVMFCLITGCTGVRSQAMSRYEDFAMTSSAERKSSMAVQVIKAPVAHNFAVDFATQYEMDEPAWESLREVVGEVFESTGQFEKIKVLDDSHHLEEILEDKFDYWLMMRVSNPELGFVERNSVNTPNIFLNLLTGYPAHFVRDEVYSLNFETEFELVSLPEQSSILTISNGVCTADGDLSYYERCSGIGAVILTSFLPTTLLPAYPASVVDSLAPSALFDAVKELMDKFPTPEVESQNRRGAVPKDETSDDGGPALE